MTPVTIFKPMFLFLYLLLLLFILQAASSMNVGLPLPPDSQDLLCEIVSCGQGTCKPTTDSLFPFDCECKRGWKQYPIGFGSWQFPPCVLPNCTVDYGCSNAAAPSSASSVSLPPPTDIWDPCTYTSCGDGSCVATNGDYRCDCYEGSTNFLNISTAACVKQCSLGADCSNLDIEIPSPPSGFTPVGKGNHESGAGRGISSTHLLLTTVFLFLAMFYRLS